MASMMTPTAFLQLGKMVQLDSGRPGVGISHNDSHVPLSGYSTVQVTAPDPFFPLNSGRQAQLYSLPRRAFVDYGDLGLP